MQTQTTVSKQDTQVEHEILLQGTINALKEATSEISTVSSIVGAQGEVIERIKYKITDAESTLKRSSRVLTHLLRRSRKRKIVSFCLLAITTLGIVSLIGITLFKG